MEKVPEDTMKRGGECKPRLENRKHRDWKSGRRKLARGVDIWANIEEIAHEAQSNIIPTNSRKQVSFLLTKYLGGWGRDFKKERWPTVF